MTTDSALPDGYSLRILTAADEKSTQALCERCADYFLLHEGAPPDRNAAADILNALPPGKSAADKFVLGLESRGKLMGIIDLVRDFPENGTWILGLMLLDPAERGKGTGRAVHRVLAARAAGRGAKNFRIGVIEENTRGRHFWSSLGYRLRKEIPMRLGRKDHRVFVMTLSVP